MVVHNNFIVFCWVLKQCCWQIFSGGTIGLENEGKVSEPSSEMSRILINEDCGTHQPLSYLWFQIMAFEPYVDGFVTFFTFVCKIMTCSLVFC
jgi:hypothetical protein